MSTCRSIALEYHSSLQTTYQKLCHLPGFVLLQSGDKKRGRYDIVSALPYDRIIIEEDTPDKQGVLEQIKKKLALIPARNDLPFQGGAIGYIAYDLSTSLLGIKTKSQPTLKDTPLLNLGFYDWAIIVDHYLKKITLFAANLQASTAEIIEYIISLWSLEAPENKAIEVTSTFIPLLSEEAYKHSFSAISEALKQGRSYQVNLTQPFHAYYTGDEWELYKKITQVNPVPFASYLKMDASALLSFSPERFLLLDQGILTTSPIKGTIHRSPNRNEDEQLKQQLATCIKNRAENVMIVDLLRNDLGKISYPGTVEVLNLCAVQSYPSLHHLVSDIRAQCMSSLHPFEAFMSCFPGGSITGAPKLEAMNIISEQEYYARGIYCGSIGYFSVHGRFDTNIAIRTITAKDEILHLAAGGGIVMDSNWEEEYRECQTKIAAIIRGLISTM